MLKIYRKKSSELEFKRLTRPPPPTTLRSIRSELHLSSTEAAASLPPPNYLAQRSAAHSPPPPLLVCVTKLGRDQGAGHLEGNVLLEGVSLLNSHHSTEDTHSLFSKKKIVQRFKDQAQEYQCCESGIRCLLEPWIRIWDEQTDNISESLETNFLG
jgi:hypothetical protein